MLCCCACCFPNWNICSLGLWFQKARHQVFKVRNDLLGRWRGRGCFLGPGISRAQSCRSNQACIFRSACDPLNVASWCTASLAPIVCLTIDRATWQVRLQLLKPSPKIASHVWNIADRCDMCCSADAFALLYSFPYSHSKQHPTASRWRKVQ
jgi:hypothetical protein